MAPLPRRDVRGELRRRLQEDLGCTRAPRSAAPGPRLLKALRIALPALPAQLAVLWPAVQTHYAGPFTTEEAVGLYRAVRMAWLAELVFGDREVAVDWLTQPKIRLLGSMPLAMAHDPRQAARIERWLIDIDAGNGP